MRRQEASATGKLKTLGAKSQACEGESGNIEAQTCNLTIAATSANPTAAYHAQGKVAGVPTSFMLDIGAAVTLLQEDRWKEVKNVDAKLEAWQGPRLIGADGTPIPVMGQVSTEVTLAGKTFTQSMAIVHSLATEGILGMDFFKESKCTIDVGKGLQHTTARGVTLPLCNSLGPKQQGRIAVQLKQTIQIPARSEMKVAAVTQGASE